MAGSIGGKFAYEVMRDPPPSLSKAGLALLVEIWEASGRAAPDESGDGPDVNVEKLASYNGNWRSIGAIRGRVISGGYLNFEDYGEGADAGFGTLNIITLSLAKRAYEALKAAGVIDNGKKPAPAKAEPIKAQPEPHDKQAAIVQRLWELTTEDNANTEDKIAEVYQQIGRLVQEAQDEGFVKKAGGLRKWLAEHPRLHISHTHAYLCLRCWKERREYDLALRHYKQRNDNWQPNRMTGPLFAIEIVQKYRDRDKAPSNTAKPISRGQIAAQQAKLWQARAHEIMAEAEKIARVNKYESATLNRSRSQRRRSHARPEPRPHERSKRRSWRPSEPNNWHAYAKKTPRRLKPPNGREPST